MSQPSFFHGVLGSLVRLSDDEKLILRTILDHDVPVPRTSSPQVRQGFLERSLLPLAGPRDPIQRAYSLVKLPPFRLTTRELEVLKHLTSGSTNKEVARALHISPRTVEVHRNRVMQKLGAKSAANLAEVLMTIGREQIQVYRQLIKRRCMWLLRFFDDWHIRLRRATPS